MDAQADPVVSTTSPKPDTNGGCTRNCMRTRRFIGCWFTYAVNILRICPRIHPAATLALFAQLVPSFGRPGAALQFPLPNPNSPASPPPTTHPPPTPSPSPCPLDYIPSAPTPKFVCEPCVAALAKGADEFPPWLQSLPRQQGRPRSQRKRRTLFARSPRTRARTNLECVHVRALHVQSADGHFLRPI